MAVKDRRLLRELGFRNPKRSVSQEAVEGEDEAEAPEPEPAAPVSTLEP